jgi:hypothetical protein
MSDQSEDVLEAVTRTSYPRLYASVDGEIHCRDVPVSMTPVVYVPGRAIGRRGHFPGGRDSDSLGLRHALTLSRILRRAASSYSYSRAASSRGYNQPGPVTPDGSTDA